MTSERHAWATLHPDAPADHRRPDTCSCGQDLDGCHGRYCPRCGVTIGPRAA